MHKFVVTSIIILIIFYFQSTRSLVFLRLDVTNIPQVLEVIRGLISVDETVGYKMPLLFNHGIIFDIYCKVPLVLLDSTILRFLSKKSIYILVGLTRTMRT